MIYFLSPGPASKTVVKICIGLCTLGPGLFYGWVFWSLDHFVGACIAIGSFLIYKVLTHLFCK